MKEPKTFSITEAQRLGFSQIIRAVEEDGIVLLERHNQKVAVMLPATPTGFVKFFRLLIAAASSNEGLKADPDFQQFLSFMVHVVEKKLGVQIASASDLLHVIEDKVTEKIRAEDSATLGSDTSAGSKGDKGRRRKSAAHS